MVSASAWLLVGAVRIPRRLWLLAFAVPTACQAMGVPGAALIRAPLHLHAVDRTPAWVRVVGGLQRWGGGWLPRAIPRGAPGGLGLHGGGRGRRDLLVQR